MRSFVAVFLLMTALLVTQLALAQGYSAIPISKCQTVVPLAQEMVLCKTPRTLSSRDLNERNLMAAGPTSVPMYLDGELTMFPLACRTTADGITLCSQCPAKDITIYVR